ncbi:hypothetical protein J7T55_012714 [Diaporthe amygdali]|uniref:uncharacterized protein n=1 Tax=Phomopsis amygdali TaxID=1214568 RepID=UPI0022FDB927|nr:uncharacterized protein J7T55_012714 [Diaporthe amygdali]KAJ0115434.1 hypothetical protein J7T55_012714 [Diaporthe amygdali]
MTTEGSYPPLPDPSTLPHDSFVPNVIVCAVVTWVIAAIFVALRFYTRTRIISVIGWSDWFIFASWFFSCGVTASAIEQTQRGMGRHVYDYDWLGSLIPFQRAAWYGVLFYTLSLGFSKVSMVLLYLSLFSYHWIRVAGRIVLAGVVIATLWMLCIVFTACVPLEAYWVYSLREQAYCQPQSMWGLHMSTDFIIFALPLPVLPTLRMPRRQKWMLFLIFSLGFFVCIVSIVRLLQLLETENHPSIDFSYDSTDLVYWTSIEVHGAIVCACAVTLKPLLNQWMPQWFSLRRNEYLGQQPAPLTIGQERSRGKLQKPDLETTGHDSWTAGRSSKDVESGSVGGSHAGALDNFQLEDESSTQGGSAYSAPAIHLSELPPESRRLAIANRDAPHYTPLPPPKARTRSLSASRGMAVGAFLDDSSIRRQHYISDTGHQRSLTSPDFYDSSSERTDWDLEQTVSAGSTSWRG